MDEHAAGTEPPPLTSGRPRFAWFDGILEGTASDPAAVHAAARRVNALDFVRMDVSVEGGRFTVLLDDHDVPSERLTDGNRSALIAALGEIARAAGGPVESTLRCTEVFAEGARETLFLPEAGSVRALTRTRGLTDADLGRGPGLAAHHDAHASRGLFLAVAALLLVALGLWLWAGGWFDRLLAAKPAALVLDTGPFGDLVAVEVDGTWGDYSVVLRRGAGFPTSNEAWDARRAGAATPLERAAVEVASTGGQVWVRLEDADQYVLTAAAADLRPLLADAARTVEVRLAGRISGVRVHVDLDRGPERK
jgi:hypothetical protein